jgi:hypothetical protein
MWNDIAKYLPNFPSAVLNGVDTHGYPFSVRCQPELDDTAQVLRVSLPQGTEIQPGPASLLCHKHDEWLWNLQSFVVRGTFAQDDHGWILCPLQFIPGAGIGGLWALVQFVRTGRRTTRRYLDKRGLQRPDIAWDQVEAMWAESTNEAG